MWLFFGPCSIDTLLNFSATCHFHMYIAPVLREVPGAVLHLESAGVHQQGLLLRARRGHRGSPAEPAIAADDVLFAVLVVLGGDLSCVRVHRENPLALR